MAKVINFYVPNRFRRKVGWVPPQRRGKLIEFRVQVKEVCLASSFSSCDFLPVFRLHWSVLPRFTSIGAICTIAGIDARA